MQEALPIAIEMLNRLVRSFAEDGEITRDELKETKTALQTIIAGIRCAIAQIDEACESAAGHAADKNRAEKVNWKDLDLSDVKPGQDQRKV